MKRALLTVALLCVAATTASAQAPFTLEWHGFVNPHYYADSRSVVGAREDMMLFYPKPIVLDSLGHDINDGWQADMLAITARLGLRISGPMMLGARSSAYVEGDFTGATNSTINNLRLRHAYIKLDWQPSSQPPTEGQHSLIIGQYWHPMVVHEIMPMTNPLNMGAPFHPYSRQPQVRYAYSYRGWEGVAVVLWQLDNMSQGLLNGVATASTAFARHSLLPELSAQLRHHSAHFFCGVGYNLKSIQPVVPDFNGKKLHQGTLTLFGAYTGNRITVRSQAMFNNTLYEIASLGGYTLLYNTRTGDWTAQEETFATLWVDLERNSGHWRPGMLAGIAHNTTEEHGEINDPAFTNYQMGRGHDLKGLWRVQPRLSYYTLNGLSFTAEAEYTHAEYLDHGVGNLRLSFSAVYSF